MNIQGLEASHQNNVIHKLVIITHNVDVLCLQEMMVAYDATIGSLRGVLKGWEFCGFKF